MFSISNTCFIAKWLNLKDAATVLPGSKINSKVAALNLDGISQS